MIRLTASDFHTLYQPFKCELRIFLKEKGEKGAPRGRMNKSFFAWAKGMKYPILQLFRITWTLEKGTLEDRAVRTIHAVERGAPVIYQGVLRTTHELAGRRCEILGEPDYLIRHPDGYIIRDSKIACNITERNHPEILRQG